MRPTTLDTMLRGRQRRASRVQGWGGALLGLCAAAPRAAAAAARRRGHCGRSPATRALGETHAPSCPACAREESLRDGLGLKHNPCPRRRHRQRRGWNPPCLRRHDRAPIIVPRPPTHVSRGSSSSSAAAATVALATTVAARRALLTAVCCSIRTLGNVARRPTACGARTGAFGTGLAQQGSAQRLGAGWRGGGAGHAHGQRYRRDRAHLQRGPGGQRLPLRPGCRDGRPQDCAGSQALHLGGSKLLGPPRSAWEAL